MINDTNEILNSLSCGIIDAYKPTILDLLSKLIKYLGLEDDGDWTQEAKEFASYASLYRRLNSISYPSAPPPASDTKDLIEKFIYLQVRKLESTVK